jgi:FMN phosphatase YigB (HAD superfamily)
MAYIGFDLDGTLGDFTPLQQFNSPPVAKDGTPNPEFFRYARLLAENDHGIFNPEVLPMVETAKNGKYRTNDKRVKAIAIYSNNSNDNLLLLVAHALTIKLFSDEWRASAVNQRIFDVVVSRNAEGRNGPNPPKTLDYLKAVFRLVTKEDDIDPKKIIFVDDLKHPDLQKNLGEQYTKVTTYVNRIASPEEIAAYFRTAIPEVIPENKYVELPDKYNILFEEQVRRGGTRRQRRAKKTRRKKKSSPKRR